MQTMCLSEPKYYQCVTKVVGYLFHWHLLIFIRLSKRESVDILIKDKPECTLQILVL